MYSQGTKDQTLATLLYATVMSRETVLIPLLFSALSDVDISAADVLNVYITEACYKKS